MNPTTDSAPAAAAGRIPGLDGIRALAVLTVFCLHTQLPTLSGGPLGVSAFFVLSGFLITSGLRREALQTGTVNIRRFYRRRVGRLGPALAALLAASVTLAAANTVWHFSDKTANLGLLLGSVAVAAAHVMNFALASSNQAYEVVPTWSLNVEEQFYVVWVLVFLAAVAARAHRYLGLLAGFGALASVSWGWWLSANGADHARVAYFTDTQVGAALAGAAIAFAVANPLVRKIVARSAGLLGPAAALALVTLLVTDPGAHVYQWRTAALIMATGSLIAVFSCGRPGVAASVFSAAPLAWLGTRSYAFYLFQVMVLQAFGGPGGFGRALIVFTVSAVAAELSWRLVEQRGLAWAHREPRVAPATQHHVPTEPILAPRRDLATASAAQR